MIVGRLNREIVLVVPTWSRNSLGEELKTGSTRTTVWAQVTPLKADERFLSHGAHSILEAKFVIRYMTVDQKYQIEYGGYTWEITGLAEVGFKEGLEITAVTNK